MQTTPQSNTDQTSTAADALLTVADVARALGIGRQTVYDLIAAGRLKAVQYGSTGRFAVPASEVEGLRGAVRTYSRRRSASAKESTTTT